MTHVDELFHPQDFQDCFAVGYIREQQHPALPLRIFTYTEKAVYDRHWTPATLACRGLIVDMRGNVIARPFPKFFNHGEEADREVHEHGGRADGEAPKRHADGIASNVHQPEERTQGDEVFAGERRHDQHGAEYEEAALEGAHHEREQKEETERVGEHGVVERPAQAERQDGPPADREERQSGRDGVVPQQPVEEPGASKGGDEV